MVTILQTLNSVDTALDTLPLDTHSAIAKSKTRRNGRVLHQDGIVGLRNFFPLFKLVLNLYVSAQTTPTLTEDEFRGW